MASPIPEAREYFDLPLQFDRDASDGLRRGYVPADMDDRWFVFWEDSWLYFHRSWTGDCIFGLLLEDQGEGVKVVEAWASRADARYSSPGVEREKELITNLIHILLLPKE